MKRMHVVSTLLVVSLLVPPLAVGQDTPASSSKPDVFTAVPENAWAVACVRNLAGLEKKVMAIGTKFGAPPMSPLMMAKAMLGLTAGVDDTGDLLVVLLPLESLGNFADKMVLLVPITDYAEFISLMEIQEAEGGLSTTTLQGVPMYIAQKDKHAILAPSAEMAKAVLESKGAGRKLFTKHQLDRAQEDDLTIWINAEPVVASDVAAPLFAMAEAMNNPGLEQLKDFKTVQIGLQVSESGVRLGFHLEAKPDTEVAKSLGGVRETSDSLLTGLPAEPFVLAIGGLYTAGSSQYMAEYFGKMLDNPKITAGGDVDAEKLKSVKDIISKMIEGLRSIAISVSALPAGPDGMIGLAKVAGLEGDARECLDSFGELIQTVKGGLFTKEEVNEWLQHMEYTPKAETIAGIEVDHFKVKLDEIEEIEAEDLETALKIIGKEGVLVRVGAVDPRHVLATFGGGAARFETAAGLVKEKKAPLADNPGIKKTAEALPKKRAGEGYIALDTGFRLASEVAKVLDEPLPFAVPEVNAPIGMAATMTSKTAQQSDVFIPMEVIMAAKDVVQAMMGMHAPPAVPPEPAAPPAPAEEPEEVPAEE
jgi:hypothetical protein